MKQFQEQKFNIPALKGISAKTIEEHLKLYSGYVKNANAVIGTLADLQKDKEKNAYAIAELGRRFSFEYNGMRNHEVYFSSLEGGPQKLNDSSPLAKLITETWSSVDDCISGMKSLAMTRGIGWAALWYDKKEGRLLASWVDEQHLGQLQGCALILGLDMWEHSYVADYQPSGKRAYVEDFFANLNWAVIEKNFKAAA